MMTVGRRTAHEALTRICFVDYDREMVLVAERRDTNTGERSIVAIADLTKLYNTKKAEVAVVVRDDCQRHGLRIRTHPPPRGRRARRAHRERRSNHHDRKSGHVRRLPAFGFHTLYRTGR